MPSFQEVLGGNTIDGKYYRRGFTTGTTATAAALAAAKGVFGELEELVDVTLPGGEILEIPVVHYEKTEKGFKATVQKYGGDDIDITNGLEISAEVILTSESHIEILGGEGVGTVTKGGLQIPMGAPAINPVPLKMIREHLTKVIGSHQGAQVIISVAGGQGAALKTFNPRLGIEGGISIIGTSGIVEPMSEEAWKQSLSIELTQKAESGLKTIVMVPGGHGEKFAIERFGVLEDEIVTMSNFTGFMLMEACRMGFSHVLLIGHVGKLIKIASGNFHTHSRVSDGRADVLCNHLAKLRAPYELIDRVREANTTDEGADMIMEAGYVAVFDSIAQEAKKRSQWHVYGAITVDVALYNMKGKLLGTTLTPEEAKVLFNPIERQVEK